MGLMGASNGLIPYCQEIQQKQNWDQRPEQNIHPPQTLDFGGSRLKRITGEEPEDALARMPVILPLQAARQYAGREAATLQASPRVSRSI